LSEDLRISAVRRLKLLVGTIRTHPLSLIGIIIVLGFGVTALLAPILAPPTSSNPYISPYDGPPDQQYFSGIQPSPTLPSSKHPFGTLAGYDIYYGCIWGIRTAFYIGILTTIVAVIVGLIVGSLAGYSEGVVDEILMRFTDAFFALPGLFYVLLVVIALPLRWDLNLGSFNFTIFLSQLDRIILALVIISWPQYARLIRAEIKKIKQQDFVEAAKAIGCSKLRVLARHILPSSLDPMLGVAFLNIGGIVTVASTVSFLGLGPRAGFAEWGSIIASGRSYLIFATADTQQFAWLIVPPGIFLSMFVLGWSLLGDIAVQLVDPTLGGR
jgi:peptide/nickel transport system permease protein